MLRHEIEQTRTTELVGLGSFDATLYQLRAMPDGFIRSAEELFNAGSPCWEYKGPSGHHQTGSEGSPAKPCGLRSHGRQGCGAGERIPNAQAVRAAIEDYNEKPPGEGGSPGRWSVLEECSTA